tara:strand:+ start:722 stop:1153 length:432 start_codon:yes stop_codon:yes gene_type:complete
MNIFKKIKLFYRMSQRFGAFSRLIKQDYDMHEARRLSEEMYPPTKEDRKFEEEYIKKNKTIKTSKAYFFSTYSLAYPILAMIYIRTHTTDTGIIIGYGLAQLGYLLIASGIIWGTFKVFDLDTRLKTIIMGICCLFIGTVFSQ